MPTSISTGRVAGGLHGVLINQDAAPRTLFGACRGPFVRGWNPESPSSVAAIPSCSPAVVGTLTLGGTVEDRVWGTATSTRLPT